MLPNTFKILSKMLNFAKFGHTVIDMNGNTFILLSGKILI